MIRIWQTLDPETDKWTYWASCSCGWGFKNDSVDMAQFIVNIHGGGVINDPRCKHGENGPPRYYLEVDEWGRIVS